ncbi:hypothetical protein CRENBAI_026443, partial [Crenichthys baileyi]
MIVLLIKRYEEMLVGKCKGRGLGSLARSSVRPTLPPGALFPTVATAKMATSGAYRLSLPLLLHVTTLLLSLLLTCSQAL